MRKRFRRILCLVLSLTAVVGLMLVRDSAAWFLTQNANPVSQSISVEKMKFEFKGVLNSYLSYSTTVNGNTTTTPFVVGGKNLIYGYSEGNTYYQKLSGVNKSSIATEVRFKIFYTDPNPAHADATTHELPLLEYAGEYTQASPVNSNDAGAKLLSVTQVTGQAWTFENGYFTRSFGAATDTTNGDSFDLLKDIQFNNQAIKDAGITQLTSGSDGKILIAIQARQSDNMIWQDIGEISSTTSAFVTNALTTTAP